MNNENQGTFLRPDPAHGCLGATGDLNSAFGIPRETTYLDDWRRRGVPSRAFVGAMQDTGTPPDNDDLASQMFACTLHVFYKHWLIDDTVNTCLKIAKSDFDSLDSFDEAIQTPQGLRRYALEKSYVILGAQDLTRSWQ
jgi:hypothetical protein